MDDKYGDFCDKELSSSDDPCNLTIPKSLSGIDRVVVTSQLVDMLNKENNALFYARFYRDRCTELEQHCRQLENEKEGVRYFWRIKCWNLSLEGVKC